MSDIFCGCGSAIGCGACWGVDPYLGVPKSPVCVVPGERLTGRIVIEPVFFAVHHSGARSGPGNNASAVSAVPSNQSLVAARGWPHEVSNFALHRPHASPWATRTKNAILHRALSIICSQPQEGTTWPKLRRLRSESVARQPCQSWESPGYPCRWRAVRRHQLRCPRTCRRKAPHRLLSCSSVRRKSPTSAWRRSTSSTENASGHPSWT